LIQRITGSEQETSSTLSSVSDGGARPLGEVTGAVGMALEITERLRERELQTSSALLNATFESISEAVLAIDADMQIRSANQRFADMWGLTMDELLAMTPSERQGHIFAMCLDPEAARATAMGHLASREERQGRLELSDGRLIHTRSAPHQVDGELLGHVISFRDVTEQVRATRLLQGQARVLEDIARDRPVDEVLNELCVTIEGYVSDALASVMVVDETGKWLRCAAAPRLKAFYDDIGTVPIADGVGSCGTSAFTGGPVVVEDIVSDPLWKDYSGVALAHELHSCWSVPVKSAGGTVIGTFATYKRVPSRPSDDDMRMVETWASLAAVAIERELAAGMRRELEDRVRQAEKMDSVGRLAGGLAHDLGNVLSAVTANCEVLRHEVESPHGEEALRDLEAAATMAGRLVDDLLNLMRPARPELVDVEAVILEMLSLLETVAGPDVGVNIDLRAQHPWARIDVPQFRQVLLNLVLNAKDAMPNGGSLSITTENPYGGVAPGHLGSLDLLIADTGMGMDERTKARAFEPFFTTKSGSGAKGVGLGLASASAAIARIGGGITCDTAPGAGTTMRVQLPLAPDPNEPPGVEAGQ
jgi:two-component system, cell cycle sensor histidine kinase and response regulator CckA